MIVCYLYTPALKLDSLVKNRESIEAGMVVVDLEDSTHTKSKQAARQKIAEFDFSPLIERGIKLGARINSITSYDGLQDMVLLKSMYESGNYSLETIFIPKVKNKRELEIYKALFSSLPFAPKLYPFIETIESVDNADEIASISDGLCFGQADLSAEMYQPNKTYINYAIAKLCIAAAKYNIMAIDGNSFEIDDIELVKQQCNASKNYGFTGKAAIHPNQVEPINKVFSVSSIDIANYQAWVDAYESSDTGFVIIDGKVIAPPFVAKAKKMLNFYHKVKK